MKQQIILSLLLLCFHFSSAQEIFQQHGFDKAPLSLSNGQYNEFFNNNEIVQIGSVLLNNQTNKIVAFVEEDTSQIKYLSDLNTRWLCIDPLAAKYPQVSPYVYCLNNPIIFVDPDGKEIKVCREEVNGKQVVSITVTGKLVNETSSGYSQEQLQGISDRISSSISSSFTGFGEDIDFNCSVNLTVANDENPLTVSDHAFRLVDAGNIPGTNGNADVLGRAPFGQNVVYISDDLVNTVQSNEKGLTDKGRGTLERTAAHELGHSGTLKHPVEGTENKNLMHQTKSPNAGKEVTECQVLQIEEAYNNNKLNKGQQTAK